MSCGTIGVRRGRWSKFDSVHLYINDQKIFINDQYIQCVFKTTNHISYNDPIKKMK